jgi:hypothetical protein
MLPEPHCSSLCGSPDSAIFIGCSDQGYGWVFPELRTGDMVAQRISESPLMRTLYLVRTDKRLSDANEHALGELLKSLRLKLTEYLGPLVEESTPNPERPAAD